MQPSSTCPACGYDLDKSAWDDGAGSQEMCPRCKIQFGYDDACGGRAQERAAYHRGWGAAWKLHGKQGE